MRHIQVYEKFENIFYKPKMYGIDIKKNGHEGFNMSQVYFLALKLFNIFNEMDIDFRVFDYNNDGDRGVAFLFNKDISISLEHLNGLSVLEFDLDNIFDDLEDFMIPNEDFEAYINSKKYNL